MYLKTKKKFGIIGFPLKNPRSIKIWKSFFKKNKIFAEMLPFEIETKKINKFYSSILKDKNLYAAAVTMPYKKYFFKKVTIKDKLTRYAKTVNLILKSKKKIYGFNTDILGAIESIPKKAENIAIIGQGGTGQAILNVLFNIKKKSKFYLITSKKNYFQKIKHLKNHKKRIKIFTQINFDVLKNIDLIINCTPLGSDLKKKYVNKSPIKENIFKLINKKTFIFDVIYKKKKKKLFFLSKKYKIRYSNGLKMNTIQAESALRILSRELELN